jgi:hypothetical protein
MVIFKFSTTRAPDRESAFALEVPSSEVPGVRTRP